MTGFKIVPIMALAGILATLFAAPASAQGGSLGWNGGTLYVPASLSTSGSECESAPGGGCSAQIKPGRHPVVLFMHGCGGPHKFQAFLDLGAIVISPNSFAGGLECMFGDQAAMTALRNSRIQDISYALGQIRAAPWADPAKLVLAGFSHGGMMAATYAGNEFKARIIMAWACNHGPDFPGLAGIAGTGPVLAVFGTADEFFRERGESGRCGEFIAGRDEPSQYVAIPDGPHTIVDHTASRKALVDFLPAALR